jgi:hypothetical protein
MWMIITIIILLIGIISTILSRIWDSKKIILGLFLKYIFGEFLLYSLLPFLLNGAISTALCAENFILGTGSN